MGLGDELIAAGQARRARRADSRKVRILGANGQERWSEVWIGNPGIAGPGETGDFQTLVSGPNARPYIAAKSERNWTWQAFECEPAELFFTPAEQAFAERHRPVIVIEPTLKPKASPNKLWPRWRHLVEMARASGIVFTQLGPRGTRGLAGVRYIETPDFRKACAVLANASLYIGPDGGLMHAAAAVGVPAIVIRGAYISHKASGYESHRNLFFGEGLGCGARVPCRCCQAAMAKITPAMVMQSIKEML